MKTFIANSVSLPNVPNEHRGNNGNCQFTVIIRAKSKKRVAELMSRPESVSSTYRHLRMFCGIHEARGEHLDIPKKDEVIYYQPGHTRTGYYAEWVEYQVRRAS